MIPTNPFSLMPAANPGLFPNLFTERPDNNVNIPTFRIPGLYNIVARQAYGVVALLASIGVQCTVPYYYPSGDSLTTQAADPNDVTPREYYTRPIDSTPEATQINSFSLMQIAIRLGGMNESPTQGLYDILDDMKVSHRQIKIRPTDQEIVDALKRIFG